MARQPPSRPDPGPSLPAFDRLASPAAPRDFAALIEAHSRPGDVVVDLHGRGGWVARAAITALRRAATFESQPLSRLLAEVVLRPPDVRHLDAAFQAISAAPRGNATIKAAIGRTYASRCPSCGRTVVLDEVLWDADGPAKRLYRCPACRDGGTRSDHRQAPVDDADRALADRTLAAEFARFAAARGAIAGRFPVPPGHAGTANGGEVPPGLLVEQLLDLHTPRQLAGLAAILGGIEDELRAAPVTAALRLALLQALLPASRLNAYPGRMAALRVAGGRLRMPAGSQWRERNPWLAFEDGYRIVRGFVQRLEGSEGRLRGPIGRLGSDLRSLGDGMANVIASLATPGGLAALAAEAELLRTSGSGPRIRLVLGQPPLPWTQDRLAAAYHGTAWVLGREAASLLPVEQLFGGPAPSRWDWQASTLRASLAAVAPALAPNGRVVLLLGSSSPEAMLAAAVGGVAAGYGLVEARTGATDDAGDGLVAFLPPDAPAHPGPRTRANIPLPSVEAPAPPRDHDPSSATAPADGNGTAVRVQPAAGIAARVVTQTAVEMLQARGEPAGLERLLGEILVGLDRSGQLGRLAARGAEPLTEAERSAAPLSEVESLLALIREELTRANNRRLQEIEPGLWWLASVEDRAAAAVPLSDRVEWGVFGLLSTAGRLSEAAFHDRVAGMFRGHDQPDEALVHACLESYRLPGTGSDLLLARDTLQERSEEHDDLISRLADMGHRLGMDVWIGRRAQGRRVRGRLLGDWLDANERWATPPLAASSAAGAVEEVDCIWYVRGRANLLFEVEWTAMLGDVVLRRHARIANDDDVIRFLVVAPERVALIRHKLATSPLLRRALDEGNWHLLKANHLRTLHGREQLSLADFEPYLGLDPAVEHVAEQLGLFG